MIEDEVDKVKVVYNSCHGGFSLSTEARNMLAALRGSPVNAYFAYSERHDMNLVIVIEALGEKASGTHSKLKIREITGRTYMIEDYDGFEAVLTPAEHATRWIHV